MKLKFFLKHLRAQKCILLLEGRSHSILINPATDTTQTVPRHTEISELLVKKICKKLAIKTI